MFWQWMDNTGKGRKKDAAVQKKKNRDYAQMFVKAAWEYSKGDAKGKFDPWWGATPTPFPRTDAPGACDAGEVIGNPHNVLKVAHPAIDYGKTLIVPCPDGYSGELKLTCDSVNDGIITKCAG